MEQTRTLSLQAAYAFGSEHGLAEQMDAIRNLVIEWDRSYTSSLRRGYVVELLEEHGLFSLFKQTHWSFGDTPTGKTMTRRFLRIKQEYEDFLAGRPDGGLDEEDSPEEQEFAAEADLRDFLAQNLALIETGLALADVRGRTGVEFPIDGGRIDILAVDRDNHFVVIELKLSRGRERTLGQILYYMAWVDRNMGGRCRGVIVAREIPEELAVAATRVDGVSLFRYQLQVSLIKES